MSPGKRYTMENKKAEERILVQRGGYEEYVADQEPAVRKALAYLTSAAEELKDCQHCGSPIVASWLDPVITRLRLAENLLSVTVEEGGVL